MLLLIEYLTAVISFILSSFIVIHSGRASPVVVHLCPEAETSEIKFYYSYLSLSDK